MIRKLQSPCVNCGEHVHTYLRLPSGKVVEYCSPKRTSRETLNRKKKQNDGKAHLSGKRFTDKLRALPGNALVSVHTNMIQYLDTPLFPWGIFVLLVVFIGWWTTGSWSEIWRELTFKMPLEEKEESEDD